MPVDMSPEAKRIWRGVLRDMGGTGVITAVEGLLLRMYCETGSRYTYTAPMLERAGPLIVAAGTGARRGELVKNPLHQIVRDDVLLLRALAGDLGLTPAARAGLTAPVQDEEDGMAALLAEPHGTW
jgi:P27 family predicted phage terminase small subunit